MPLPSLKSICDGLVASTDLKLTLHLHVEGVNFHIRTNDEGLVGKLRDYFGALCDAQPRAGAEHEVTIVAIEAPAPSLPEGFVDWPREGGKTGRKEAYLDFDDGRIVRKVRTGMHFLLQERALVAVGPCRANDNQIINFVNAQYMALKLEQGYQLCHAAGVSFKEAGLAIAARAGAGKSTLALHLISFGLDFVSNDRLLIRARGGHAELAGIPKMPRVNPGTLLNNEDLHGILPASRVAELTSLPQDELWELEEKYDVMVEQVYGKGRCHFEAKLNAVLILNWSFSSEAPVSFERVDLASRPDLLQLIMKSPGVFHRGPSGRPAPPSHSPEPAGYLQHLRDVPVFEASGRPDFDAALPFCRELLGCS